MFEGANVKRGSKAWGSSGSFGSIGNTKSVPLDKAITGIIQKLDEGVNSARENVGTSQSAAVDGIKADRSSLGDIDDDLVEGDG